MRHGIGVVGVKDPRVLESETLELFRRADRMSGVRIAIQVFGSASHLRQRQQLDRQNLIELTQEGSATFGISVAGVHRTVRFGVRRFSRLRVYKGLRLSATDF